MMRRLTGVASAAALLLTAGQAAWAQTGGATVESTADLARFCAMEDRTFCYGYINGAGQFYRALVGNPEVDVDPFVCPGREVSEDEAAAIFLDWVDAHPDAGDEPAIDGLFRAWVEAFPCE